MVESEVERNGDYTKLGCELIETKKCNIVYYNVPESSKDESADRMEDDFDLITYIISRFIFKLANASII